jgi:hypothetical protein
MAIDQILDGRGNGYLAGVNSKYQALIRSITVPLIAEASLLGDAYSWTAVSANLAANETALCVVNDSTTKWLVISKAYVWSDVATQIKFHLPAAATWSGTAVVGKNLNTNFADSAPASGYADETGTTFAAANTIETVYAPLSTNGESTTSLGVWVDFKDAVILGRNEALAADIVADSGAFECCFFGYFIEAPS